VSTPNTPLNSAAQRLLLELAEQTGLTPPEVLDKALDVYRRKLFFEQMNAGYAELRADPTAWAALEAERSLWDVTLMDGLDADERWTADGHCLNREHE
jgi:hypothetical protein